MQAPILGFNQSRPELVDAVVQRVCLGVKDAQLVLNDAAYHEVRRLQSHGGPELARWQSLARSLGRMSAEEQNRELEELVRYYANDVAGNFDPRVYKFATRALPGLLGGLLSPRATAKNLPRIIASMRPGGAGAGFATLDDRVIVEGSVDTIARLAQKGTLVFVPTHLSNLDSVVFGFALERAHLPPATYGAGKNLFTNPILSFFMQNLGAYRVDRRLKHALYKDVLKTYSCVLIERGYHSLFFPGGTRSRSGGVERRLKLGLAGTGLEAFARTASAGHPQKVFFVPATINYLLTLEAETLIDDFLQEEGKARYIIEDDESTRFARVTAFMQKLLGLDAGCVIRFSKPMDCFGNTVDAEGRSYDARGREVDPTSYVMGSGDVPSHDPAREAQYTREFGDSVTDAFRRDTVAMSTHLVAAAAFARLHASATSGGRGAKDVFAMLRQVEHVSIPREELSTAVDALLDRARELEQRGGIVLAKNLHGKSGDEVVEGALRAFAGYHQRPVIEPRAGAHGGSELVLADPRLLFYYQNRLAVHGLAIDFIAPKSRAWAATSAA
jgi:glycerol-3-phosphate O-acyltransferase